MTGGWKYIKLGDKRCVEAEHATWPVARQANSFYLPLGSEPGVAHVLLRYRDLKEISDAANASSSAAYLPLVFNTGPTPAVEVNIRKLYLISARRVTAGPQASDNAVYLVKLADVRYLAQRFAPVLNHKVADAAATWASYATEIWNEMSTLLGSFPGLPYTPKGTPQHLKFVGVSAWTALRITLEKIGCAIAYNPLTDAFSIVRLGTTQTIADGGAEKLFESQSIEGQATRFPATVRVNFQSTATNVASGETGAVAGTIHNLWEDFDPDTVNDLANRATEIANNWLADRRTDTNKTIYRALVKTILPGSQVKAVVWGDWGKDSYGAFTEYVTHPGLPRATCDDLDIQYWLEVAELTSALNPGSSATARILKGSWVDAGFTQVIVYDVIGSFTGEAGDRCLIWYHRESEKWIVLNLAC